MGRAGRQAFETFGTEPLVGAGTNQLTLRMNALPPLQSGSVCYLVGAGLSAASLYQVPVAARFFSRTFGKQYGARMAKVDLTTADPRLNSLLDRLEREYGPLDTLDLETVMADLHVRAFGIGFAWETQGFVAPTSRPIPELRHDYDLLLHYISERLPWLNESSPICEKVKAFVDLIRPEDSVITLNYDTTLEFHLHKCKGESGHHLSHLESSLAAPWTRLDSAAAPVFSLAGPSCTRGVLTKLHGSKDWYTCPNDFCPNRHHIHPWSMWFRGSPRPTGETIPQCTQCGSSRRMVIIPPTASKAFDEFPKLGVMWAQSFEAFRWSQRWCLIGVSLARSDFHLSTFLRSLSRVTFGSLNLGAFPTICIVDTKPRGVANRLAEAMAPLPQAALRRGSIPIYTFRSIKKFLSFAAASDQRPPPGGS